MPHLRHIAKQILAKLREDEVALWYSPWLTSTLRYSITEKLTLVGQTNTATSVDQIKRPKDLEVEHPLEAGRRRPFDKE